MLAKSELSQILNKVETDLKGQRWELGGSERTGSVSNEQEVSRGGRELTKLESVAVGSQEQT